jgi:hypothetical protein
MGEPLKASANSRYQFSWTRECAGRITDLLKSQELTVYDFATIDLNGKLEMQLPRLERYPPSLNVTVRPQSVSCLCFFRYGEARCCRRGFGGTRPKLLRTDPSSVCVVPDAPNRRGEDRPTMNNKRHTRSRDAIDQDVSIPRMPRDLDPESLEYRP